MVANHFVYHFTKNAYWELTHDKFNCYHYLTSYGTYSFYKVFYSEQEVLDDYQIKRDKAKILQTERNLTKWWSIAQIVPMSLAEWFKLDDLTQEAIYLLAEETISQKNKEYNEQKKQQELALMESSRELKFPNQVGSNTSRYFQ